MDFLAKELNNVSISSDYTKEEINATAQLYDQLKAKGSNKQFFL